MGKTLFILVIVLLAAGQVTAETYKWIDDSGTLNFTEDYSKIPKKYRKKIQVIGDVTETPSNAATGIDEKSRDSTEKSTPVKNENVSADKQEKKVTYGGKSGDDWKAEFSKLKDEIKSVQDEIDAKKNKLSDPASLPRGQYLGIEYSIKELETNLSNLQKRKDSLDEAASRAGVPFELR
jgi:predicted RNase H-like nuclease (RuvC/YqgF family)